MVNLVPFGVTQLESVSISFHLFVRARRWRTLIRSFVHIHIHTFNKTAIIVHSGVLSERNARAAHVHVFPSVLRHLCGVRSRAETNFICASGAHLQKKLNCGLAKLTRALVVCEHISRESKYHFVYVHV